MKVYMFTTKSSYSGGCIIIAANNKDEAKDILLLIDDFMFDWYSDPLELSQLTANVDTPQVLVNETYFE